MARSRQHIPTPDEIAEIVRRREAGEDTLPVVDPTIADAPSSVRAVSAKIDQLGGQVAHLMRTRGPTTVEEVRRAFDLALKQFNLEPVIELARMVCQTRVTAEGDVVFSLDPGTRIRILELLAKFRMPTLKAVEVGGSVSHEHKITIVRFGDDGSVRQEKIKDDHTAPVIDVKEVASG